MGWYLRNWGVYDFDFYLFEISIKNPNFWYMSRVTAFKTEMRLLAISTGVLSVLREAPSEASHLSSKPNQLSTLNPNLLRDLETVYDLG